jgi:hypothetical protein
MSLDRGTRAPSTRDGASPPGCRRRSRRSCRLTNPQANLHLSAFIVRSNVVTAATPRASPVFYKRRNTGLRSFKIEAQPAEASAENPDAAPRAPTGTLTMDKRNERRNG